MPPRRRPLAPNALALWALRALFATLAACGTRSTRVAAPPCARVVRTLRAITAAPARPPALAAALTPALTPARCGEPVYCDAPAPPLAPRAPWRHWSTALYASPSGASHRARDLVLRVGEPQWALAKFAYDAVDKDLEDEDVDVFVLRDCVAWEHLGTARTTTGRPAHDPVDGVRDTGGRVYFPIPPERALGPGTHRVLFVVRGDHSRTEATLEILAPGARIALTDVDGTLTRSENALVPSVLFRGDGPVVHPGAPDALWALAHRGYHIVYLTARPEWLAPATRAWLRLRGFPPGALHTTLGATGVIGTAAAEFKRDELRAFAAHTGGAPDYAFGNMPSDVRAYTDAGVAPSHAFYYRLDADLAGGTRIDDYRALVPVFTALPSVCP